MASTLPEHSAVKAPEDASARSSQTLHRWGLLAGLCLVLASVATLGLRAWQTSRIPPATDWAAAAEVVNEAWAPGDAFRVLPAWDSRPRVFLQDKDYIPAAHAYGGDVAP